MKKQWPLLFFLIVVVLFFNVFFLRGLLPVPSDDIVGLYYPFFDHYKEYPRGLPYKNFLITDPVRQQYPWRNLSISLEKKLQLPLWNPYNFSGTPLLANFQSAAFYPLNALFFLFPFPLAWSFLIVLQPLLAGFFFYFYLRNLRLQQLASLLGAISFSFSGFFVSWMEWGTLVHVALWMPLLFLSADKIVQSFSNKKISNNKKKLLWSLIFLFALVSSFFAGHLQTFFYVFLVTIFYALLRWWQFGNKTKIGFIFLICLLFFLFITSIQWIPAFQFILLSARNIDQNWMNEGWFIPWQNLSQFIAPDFFGNPVTNNYWGVWNYGEFIGYIGIFPLIMALFAMFFRQDKKTLFFGSIFFLSLLFAFPTIPGQLPFLLKIPFLSTSQPTRLLVLIDFSLCVLAALGLDHFVKSKKGVFYPVIFIAMFYTALWIITFLIPHFHPEVLKKALTARRNLIFPTILFLTTTLVVYYTTRRREYPYVIFIVLIILTAFDLLRFSEKYLPFSSSSYLYPSTSLTVYLQSHLNGYRIMETDRRIFPPDFSIMYHLQSVDGYDPLYVLRYGEFISASERGGPDIHAPFGFGRIITPENYHSRLIDLLGVKYILTLDTIKDNKLQKVFEEGKTRVYENKSVLPRIFFVQEIHDAYMNKQAIQFLFDRHNNLKNSAVVEYTEKDTSHKHSNRLLSIGKIINLQYSENTVSFNTHNNADGFLILTDSYYPTWHATIDGRETKIYRTDYMFRGIFVPKGNHRIVFYDALF